MMTVSLLLNWIVGPAVMFALAWLLLPDQPAYRTGVILVGLARCIAMVLVWTDLASGDREMAAVLVALNAVFQVLLYAVLGVFYLNVLPGWLGLGAQSLAVSMADIAVTVAVFLGIPLVAGYLTRTLGERYRGRDWYESKFLPRIGPIALYGLLFTVVVLFALQGKTITSQPVNVVRIALPLLAYFVIMWFGGVAIARRLRLTYARTASLAFSAASNDFELAIAVAIGVFGATSGQALAGVVGPLIEVPVLLGWSTSPCGCTAGSDGPKTRPPVPRPLPARALRSARPGSPAGPEASDRRRKVVVNATLTGSGTQDLLLKLRAADEQQHLRKVCEQLARRAWLVPWSAATDTGLTGHARPPSTVTSGAAGLPLSEHEGPST